MPEPPTPPEVPTPGPTDPSGDPGGPADPSGDPGGQDSGDPGDVPPGTSPTTPGEEETVTIDDGDRSISVTSPDGQGQVKVTVDDGSGPPKSYTLDFGDPSTPAGTPTPGAAGTPGPTGGPDQPQSFGPQGGGNQAPTLDQPIEPGEDGKCVIQDGDLTITAERPDGSADTVVVTVDDGTGDPTTYNLDYSGDDGPAATPQPRPGEPQQLYQQLDDRLDGVINDLDEAQRADPAAVEPGIDPGARSPLERDPAGQFATGTEPAMDPGAQSPLDRDPAGQYAEPAYASTTPQASLPSDSAGSFLADPGDGQAGGQAGAFGAPEHGEYASVPSHEEGEAGLASAADGGDGHQQTGAMGGMPMMGGAGGGAGGGDQERTTGAQWRTTGDLFDDDADTQLRGAFGEGAS